MKKKFLVVALALVLALAMTTTVFADTPNVAGDVAKAPIQPPVKTATQTNFTKKASNTTFIKNGARVYSGKFYCLETSTLSNTSYAKFVAAKTGSVFLGGPTNITLSGYVTLCDKNKKSISDKTYIWSASDNPMAYATFAVKKGRTYYYRFTNTASPLQDAEGNAFYGFVFKYITKGVSESSGASKAKSKRIKRKTRKWGTVLSGGSAKADYYKFYSSKQKLKLYFKGNTSGTLCAKVTHRYNGRTYTRMLNLTRYHYTPLTVTSGGKGTWYVKVYRKNIKQSGSYYLYWK